MTTAISIQNVSKAYRLGVIGHGTLREDLQSWWAKVRGKEDPNRIIGSKEAIEGDTLWALRDVSFDVEQGSVWGIIGANGAGKSTLLKILSRVTAPTGGQIKVRGRVASLLEVGTGFHPELTGRENIFLNGAILGMTKAEVRKKFDEIVAFSGIEKFIDTPVKRYSSGMYVRLAFAVAAHLDPEILVVDEVLAVGDAVFQKKCLGKMGAVAREGRTVLFVSHNMPSIVSLCQNAVWLQHGRIYDQGLAADIVEKYQTDVYNRHGSFGIESTANHKGTGAVVITSLSAYSNNEVGRSELKSGNPLHMAFKYASKVSPIDVDLEISWVNSRGEWCMHLNSYTLKQSIQLANSKGLIQCHMEKCPLMAGEYSIQYKLYDLHGTILDQVKDAAIITVAAGDYYGTGRRPASSMCTVLVDYRFDAVSVPLSNQPKSNAKMDDSNRDGYSTNPIQ